MIDNKNFTNLSQLHLWSEYIVRIIKFALCYDVDFCYFNLDIC